MEEFRTSFSVQQCWNCQSFDHLAKTVGPKPDVLSVGKAIIRKDAQIKRKSSQNAPIVKGHCILHKTYKKHAFRQHVLDSQKSYASILRQNSAPLQLQDKTFIFSAEHLLKVAANVAMHSSRSATNKFAAQIPPRTQLTRNQVCVAEFPKLPKSLRC